MTIQRLRVTFTGGTMGDGVATHYAVPGGGMQPLFVAFWSSCMNQMAGFVNSTVPDNGETFDEGSGTLNGAWTNGVTTSKVGGGAGGAAGGVGACITWDTASIHQGRKVRGRTFVVPLAANQYDPDGTISTAVRASLLSAANTLLTGSAGAMRIWCRPDKGTSNGAAYAVTGARVADHVSWLRTRR